MSFDCIVHKKARCDDIQKQRTLELSYAIDIGMEQLRRKQLVDGSTSRKKMKRKIDALAKGK